jgi:hypothetical protein
MERLLMSVDQVLFWIAVAVFAIGLASASALT